MRKFKIGVIAFIIASTILSVIGLLETIDPDKASYEKYVEGEYYFLAHARTTAPTDPGLINNTNLDTSDPRNTLLLTTNSDVYAYDLQGAYCTVVHSGNTYRNFPVNRLSYVSDEDYQVLSGKRYTYEEYCERLNAVRNGQESENILSDQRMLGDGRKGETGRVFACAQLILNVFVVAWYVFAGGSLDEFGKELLFVFWVLVNLFLDIVIFNLTILGRLT